MANMYLVCGVSGSGKTTLSKMLEEKTGIKRLGVDDFYAMVNGDECRHVNKFEVWIEYFKAIHEMEEINQDVIIDTNALTYSQRVQFVDWFPTFKHHMIFLCADHNLRKKNNKSRRRQIPDDILDNMALRVEMPTAKSDKEWDTITYIMNDDNHFQEPMLGKGEINILPAIKELAK